MTDDIKQERLLAVQRFLDGENAESICASLGRSKTWLYKWIQRYSDDNPSWFESQSTRPLTLGLRTSPEIEELVKTVRLNLEDRQLFYGAQAILWELKDLGLSPLPSLRTINRLLSRNMLMHRRSGRYEPKGKKYPALPSRWPNQTHQADLVGPCYLKGPVRFYSLNAVDLCTGRCGVQALSSKSGPSVIEGLWAIWKRQGIPDNLQVDNAMSFFGSPTHPRGMGPLIRLCLHHGVEPWFIPMAEPWRNGVIEKFNDHYQQRFLSKIVIGTADDLVKASLDFEQRHNGSYRYSKLGGRTPLVALAAFKKKLRFPPPGKAPLRPLKKPKAGCYHLVRFIRSDKKLNVFGEMFLVPPELMYEYVVATVDVKEQKLKLYLDKTQVEEINYDMF
jgi:transposase-like protein